MKLTSLTLLSFAISTPTSVPPLGSFVAKTQKQKSCKPGRELTPPQEGCSSPEHLQHTLGIDTKSKDLLLLGDGDGGEGGGGGALPHHRVAARHGQGGVPTVNSHREVEGSDDP